jgi:putative DNA primase/helicase
MDNTTLQDSVAALKPAEQLKGFLEAVFAGVAGQYIQFYRLPSRISLCTNKIDDSLVELLIGWNETDDVYVCAGLSPRDFGPHHRCLANEISGITGLWLDIDMQGPHHKKQNLPPDDEAGRQLISEMGLAPTILLHTGHGFHAWWLFREPWIFESDAERQKAARLAKAWNATLRVRASAHQWDTDAVGDLAHLMRIPGLWNRKGEPVPVRIREAMDDAF